MGYKLIVYGRIEGARDPNREREAPFRGALYHHNRCALEALPDTDDDWPFLTRHMFDVASPKLGLSFDRGIFQTQIVHFGASLKTADRDGTEFVETWLAKFEKHLLSSLVWLSATVHFEHEILGQGTVHYETTSGSLREVLEEFRLVGTRVQADLEWRRSPEPPASSFQAP